MWTVDKQFLDYLASEVGNPNKPFVSKGKTVMSLKDLLKEMEQGSDMGRRLYTELHSNPRYQTGFEAWKKQTQANENT